MSETIVGGRYFTASGVCVDAHGQRLEETPPMYLPADFPGLKALHAAGIFTIEDVPTTAAELTAVKGVGAQTAASILEALA